MHSTIPTKLYRPSNGSEGANFIDHWCGHCKRDAKFRDTQDAEDGCPIVANSLGYGIDHPKYPKEWVVNIGDVDGSTARCTAFEKE